MINSQLSVAQFQLKTKHFKILSTISIVAIILMTWHDLDHLRVLIHRDYTIVPQQFVTIIVAHIPAFFALYM